MNERIRELIKQADIEFDVSSDHYGIDTAVVIPYDLEKFAELIAQHILDKLKVERERYANPGMYNTEEYYIKMDAKVDVLEDAISMIRRDFGVE